MRKFLIPAAVALGVLLSVTACGSGENAESPVTTPSAGTIDPETQAIYDKMEENSAEQDRLRDSGAAQARADWTEAWSLATVRTSLCEKLQRFDTYTVSQMITQEVAGTANAASWDAYERGYNEQIQTELKGAC